MEMIKRYMIVQGIQTGKGELIPIWDSRLKFEKDDDCGEKLSVSGDYHYCFSLVDMVFDLKTKSISTGIVVDYYGDNSKSEFTKGQVVLVESGKQHRHLVKTKIDDIIFEEFDIEIRRGKKMDYWVKIFNDIYPELEIVPDQLYCIRLWKPTYVLKNGIKTSYNHQLFHFDE